MHSIGSEVLHPAHEAPNFSVFAAALLILFYALNLRTGLPGWVNRLAIIFVWVTLTIYTALQAVDGVVLKRAVDAKVAAPTAEKVAHFASAVIIC